MATHLPSLVARRLRKLRLQRCLTQAQLAERAHMAPAEISRFENGHRTPNLATLERLGRALMVPCWTLLREEPVDDLQRLTQMGELETLFRLLQDQTPATRQRILSIVEILVASEGADAQSLSPGRRTLLADGSDATKFGELEVFIESTGTDH